ncbi:substrate-binding domain-containing protein [Aeromonas simiae]|uniref:substrate-binding domain-containing protein n=1 Tax=Aeromonas simiae TaxID=218936 RepID=UPI00266C6EB2|nr:substrate-binding domain-containing protein [Aeromonas simiae]MDO2948504.1 substrate-binding domain-containing protein [Aeromonas simiae]MDO2955887.1 substrate-binding domain-containing protein [Aeromonas simiae]
MANIRDVAALAGVSTTTVSHVINETRFVADETRERVFAAMRDLNYAPSLVARSLKVKETHSIGMLVTTSSNPFFAEVVRGVERYCFEQGYNLMLGNTEGEATTAQSYLKMMLRKRVDGLLIMCSEGQREVLGQLDWLGDLPVVQMDWGSGGACDLIADNSHHGGMLATRHLIALGHKKMGCITGPRDRAPGTERLAGFIEALQEAGLPLRSDWILEGNFDCASGHQAMRSLLALSERPTALFVCNDMMAMGAISAATEAGLRIPEDLSIIGYDNVALAEYMSPPLTTINQPKEELGRLAVTRLLTRINGERPQETLITLEPNLVIRRSCSAPSTQ